MLLSDGPPAGPGRACRRSTTSGGERELIIDLAERVGVRFAAISDQTKAASRRATRPGPRSRQPSRCLGDRQGLRRPVRILLSRSDHGSGCRHRLVRRRHPRRLLPPSRLRRRRDGVARRTEKPIAVVTNYTQVKHDELSLTLSRAGVPVLDGTANALVAVRGALAYRDFLARAEDAPRRRFRRHRKRDARAAALRPRRQSDALGRGGEPRAAVGLGHSRRSARSRREPRNRPSRLRTGSAIRSC